MRSLLRALPVVIAVLAGQAFAAEPVKAPPSAMVTVKHAEWGFQLSVPKAAKKHSLPAEDDIQLYELYVLDDAVYFVRVTRTPPNSLTSTAIEQMIQAVAKSQSTSGTPARWEMESKQGDLFKGLSRAIRVDDSSAKAEYLRKVFAGDNGFESFSVTPLKDETSPMLTVGVAGPASRSEEIEPAAKYLAYGVARIEKAVTPSEPAQPAAAEPVIDGSKASAKPVTKPEAAVKPGRPAEPPKAGAKQTDPQTTDKPRPRTLKKGEIELAGFVESIDESAKSMVLVVEQITLPKLKPITLDPVRRKTVLFTKLPSGTEPSSRVTVVGKNTGIGSSMTANTIVLKAQPSPTDTP